MRILLSSYRFSPDVGGIETVSEILAREFREAGHEVRVVTMTRSNRNETGEFSVIRRPDKRHLVRLAHWCDVLFQNNISLWSLWPTLLMRKPWLVVHQTWITRTDGTVGWQDMLKRFLLGFGEASSISKAVAKTVPTSAIVPNPFQDDVFKLLPGIPREREIVFVGRLVSDKGGDILLQALAPLKRIGIHPRATIVGSGPEEIRLRELADTLGVSAQVEFVGVKKGTELAQLLNAHRILVVPSRWAEPFGIVALEGIACGCAVIGSENGGLREAIGPCGITFPNGNVNALANAIHGMLTNETLFHQQLVGREQHLARHRPGIIAAQYLSRMKEMIT